MAKTAKETENSNEKRIPLVTKGIIEFCKENKFNSLTGVLLSKEKGFPFIAFTYNPDSDIKRGSQPIPVARRPEPQFLLFSAKTTEALGIDDDYQVKDNLAEFLEEFILVQVETRDTQELVWRISKRGSSNSIDISDLL